MGDVLVDLGQHGRVGVARQDGEGEGIDAALERACRP
jgi:hypothetical protein